jgi:hypothetical protein
MDKVKLTYSIGGIEYRLTDPEHFYAFLSRRDINTNLSVELKEYLYKFADKLQVEHTSVN